MNKYLALLLICSPIITSCGTVQFSSEENYRNELQKYVGESIEIVVNDLGHADNLSESPNGNRLFVYSSAFTSTSPVNCSTDSQGIETCTGGNTNEYWCKTYYEVDDENLVVDFSYKGNNCKKCDTDDVLLCF